MPDETTTLKQKNIKLHKENEKLKKELENASLDLKKLKLDHHEKLLKFEKLYFRLSQKVSLSIDAINKKKEKLQPTREDYERWETANNIRVRPTHFTNCLVVKCVGLTPLFIL